MEVGVFKSEESRKAILDRYDQILSTFPFKKNYVNTSFGKTFILEAGDKEAPALILLHGSCSNSAFWFGEILALSSMYHVLAVDIIGEAGKSSEIRPQIKGEGYADWLMEVLRELSTDKAVIMGNSLGSWLALKFAVKYPEVVSKLIVIAPSGLSEQNLDFLDRARNADSNDEKLTLDNSVTKGIELPKEVEEFINMILQGYDPITEELPKYSDDEILRLNMPVLFIGGKCDVMIDMTSAAKRLRALLPDSQIHLLEDTGHFVMNSLEFVTPFLSKTANDL